LSFEWVKWMVDKLRFWNDAVTKLTILNFVETVTDKSSPKYVPPSERVATFDNDGTLWCEKPTYIQLFFTLNRLKQMAEADPKLLKKHAFKAAVQDDMNYFAKLYPNDIPSLMKIVFDTHQGMSQKEFKELAYEFLTNTNHPRFGVPFKQCIYQPMVELMHYLRDNDFKVFIASAGGMSFVRTVSEEIYDLPRENVIGSNIAFEMEKIDNRIVLMRKPGLVEPFDDGPGKPVNIELHIGRSPIIAVGNANGDLEMMEYAESNDGPFLNLLLRHDDVEREYSYDTGAEKIQQKARERGWTIISMKNDFNKVFATF
jgi:phosphoserine phosphatase